MKTEKLIIVGKTGSGKDFLLKSMIDKGLSYEPKFTSRPKREGEIDGVNYRFITNDIFEEMWSRSEIKFFQEFTIFGDKWVYGITNQNFLDGQVFIMTPHEISQMTDQDRKNCFIVYLDIDEDVRRDRLGKRNDGNDSIDRRLNADNFDFSEFDTWDLKIIDPEFDPELVYSLMV